MDNMESVGEIMMADSSVLVIFGGKVKDVVVLDISSIWVFPCRLSEE